MNIYDELALMSQRLDKVQLRISDHKSDIKNVLDNARMTDKWRKELVGAISQLDIERGEIINELVQIQKMKDFLWENK